MSLYSKEYDRSNPEIAEKLQILDDMNKSATLMIHSWGDFYRHLGDMREQAFTTLGVTPMLTGLAALQSAFLKAMERLPDEGDIKSLLYLAHEILVMEPEAIGIKLFFTQREQMEQYASMVGSIRDALTKAAEASGSADSIIRRLMRGGPGEPGSEE